MYSTLLAALAQGSDDSAVITVNRRLARTISSAYDDGCRRNGAAVWEQAAVFPLEQWLRRCLWYYGDDVALLSAAQSACLWRQVIDTDARSRNLDLLQTGTTAALAAQAHSLLCRYLVPDGWIAADEEQRSFVRWRAAYKRRCREEGWIDPAALLNEVGERIAADAAPFLPRRLFFVGFEHLYPALQKLLERLRRCGCEVNTLVPRYRGAVAVSGAVYADEEQELDAMLHWAQQQLRGSTDTTVALVVPELQRLQGEIVRRFSRLQQHTDSANELNISLGRALDGYGMIATALELLSCTAVPDFSTLSYLLRSPWFGSADEAVPRARFEQWLRRHNFTSVPLADVAALVRRSAISIPVFVTAVARLREYIAADDALPISTWRERFSTVLHQLGWPGERPLDSESYQLLQVWHEKLLPELASLELVHPPCRRANACAWLRHLCRQQVFQPRSTGRRLQVIGLLESVGLGFDAAWVMGLNQQVMPGRLEYNPFLPLPLQRAARMPHSSIEHENGRSAAMMERLLTLAAQLRLSYSRCSNGSAVEPSPFIPAAISFDHPLVSADSCAAADWRAAMQCLVDERGIAMTADELSRPVSGGSTLLRDQALCPFRAYARHRLGAVALEVPRRGMDMRVKGNILHQCMELIWQRLEEQRCLLACGDDELQRLLHDVAATVLDRQLLAPSAREVAELELCRLKELLRRWLVQVEMERPRFEVVAREHTCAMQVGPLLISARLDRVDKVDAGLVVIDYKSGAVRLNDLLDDDLTSPQLPLYAVKSDMEGVVAVAFARIAAQECALIGIGGADGIAAGIKTAAEDKGGWAQLCARWQVRLDALASNFAAAEAAVAPVNEDACRYCDLQPLCRYSDNATVGGDNDAA